MVYGCCERCILEGFGEMWARARKVVRYGTVIYVSIFMSLDEFPISHLQGMRKMYMKHLEMSKYNFWDERKVLKYSDNWNTVDISIIDLVL